MRASKDGIDVGLIVRDIEASLRFYVDGLGLELVEELEIPWGTMHRLRFGESWLKLVVPTTAPDVDVPVGLDAAPGIRYITFEVDDVEDAYTRVTNDGAGVYHALGPFGSKGVVMGMVLDPDDNVVELLHRPPSAAVT